MKKHLFITSNIYSLFSLLLTICIFILSNSICKGQVFQSDAAKVSFSYPTGFSEAPKWTSGHIIMKLRNYDGITITMSLNEINAPSDLDPWNEDIFQFCKKAAMSDTNEQNIKFEKDIINAKSGPKKCIFRLHKNKNLGFYTFDYTFFHYGSMISVSVMVTDWNGNLSSINKYKELIEGISFEK